MQSKLKNMPGVAWLVIGICVTAILIPSAAFASGALTFNGIEGQNKLKADVTAQGQLMTAPADLSSTFSSQEGLVDGESGIVDLYNASTGEAAVITSIHIDSFALSGTDPRVQVDAGSPGTDGACGSLQAVIDDVDPSTNGIVVLPYQPGYVIPAGGALCASTSNSSALISANGYVVPGADAPSSPQ